MLDIHLTLSWDTDKTDVDLHFVRNNMNYFSNTREGNDCFYKMKNPRWGESVNNPHLDIDDINGFGPENIILRKARDGLYYIVVHFYKNRIRNATNANLVVRLKGERPRNFGPIQLVRTGDKVVVGVLRVRDGNIEILSGTNARNISSTTRR